MLKRIPVLIALISTVFAAWSPQLAGAAQCTMTATPSSGAAVGSTITLAGSGWTPGETIFVNLGGIQLGQFTADAGGVVSATATVPSLSLGSQTLFAFNNAATCESNSQFPIIDAPPPPPPLPCTISASPAGGSAVGATFSISGSGWAANDTVFVNLGGVQLGQFDADAAGGLAASAVVPTLASGDQMLFAFNSAATCETSISYAVVSPSATTTAAPTATDAPTTTASATTTAPVTTPNAPAATVAPAATAASTTTISAADKAVPTTTDATTNPADDPGVGGTDSGPASDNTNSRGPSPLMILLAVGGIGMAAAAWWRYSHRSAANSAG